MQVNYAQCKGYVLQAGHTDKGRALQAGHTNKGRALQVSHDTPKAHIAGQLHKIEDKGRLCPKSLYVWVYLGYEGFG